MLLQSVLDRAESAIRRGGGTSAVPELLRQLRGTVIPEPRRDKPHRDAWALWRRRHQNGARQAHQRWHAYADETPR
jgi:hypothetical protein